MCAQMYIVYVGPFCVCCSRGLCNAVFVKNAQCALFTNTLSQDFFFINTGVWSPGPNHSYFYFLFYLEWFYITEQINSWHSYFSFSLSNQDISQKACQNMLPLFGSCLWSRFFVSSQIQYFFPLLSLHFMLCGPRKWKYIQQTK